MSTPPNSVTAIPSTSSSSCGPGKGSRFPRLQECAHFHYEVSTVDLPKNFKIIMVDSSSSPPSDSSNEPPTTNTHSKPNVNSNSIVGSSTSPTCPAETHLFHLQVTANEKRWIIYRSHENFRYLDKYLHDCIFDRKFSCLEEIGSLGNDTISKSSSKKPATNNEQIKQLRVSLSAYLTRFSEIAFVNPINCGPILNWFEIDNRGNRMLAIDDSPINIPGVAAAVVKKRYVAQSPDELSLDVGNMISVIDMPPSDESVWWRGKKELEVGFFPADCVELIKCNQHLSNQVAEHLPKLGQNQSVRLKHGKLITLLRSFFNTRPARNHLQSKGIIKQRVFACDLGEHLSNTQQEVPKILSICTQFIEKHGIVDGIYRHTGLQSNIQKLRNAFDEEKFAEIEQEVYVNDVHSVSSLLKMYFRELPNPLLTYQLYHKFIKSINVEDKIIEIHDVVQQLPPPHYRTLAFLMKHLHKMSDFSPETNMNTKNLAIVWAPNLLKSREMDSKDSMQFDMLHSITLQANISEFLIANADTIFNDKFASLVRKTDVKNNIAKTYRPISICYNNGPAKLLSLEEAQDKYKQVGPAELPKYHTVIEIPDLKKKKPKDKDKKSSAQAANPVPANVQIQQQFELLQQQQQQISQTPPTQTQLPMSISSHSVSQSAPSNLLTGSSQSVMTASTISQPAPVTTNTGSSSPAPFKSLFRNLRVGSLKHQSPNHNSQNSPITIHQQQDTLKLLNSELTMSSPTKMSRTVSTNQSGGSFKPVSSTVGITPSPESSSASMTKSELYSNCISQLQSTHNALREANLTNFTGSLSPCGATTIAPILVRSNKLNQSQSSVHSSTNGLIHHPKQMLTTFGSPSSSSTISPLAAVSDLKKGSDASIATNPIPCKRRTAVQQANNLPQSSSSLTVSQPESAQNGAESKRRGGAGLNLGDHEYTDIDANQSPPPISQRKSVNDDDMQRLVAYINQFEQDSNSNIRAAAKSEPHLVTLAAGSVGGGETTEASPVQPSENVVDPVAVSSAAKLRLSSSSLSSSGSEVDDGDDESLDDGLDAIKPSTTQSSPENDARLGNEYEELEMPDVAVGRRSEDAVIKRDHVDRRTYIVNKLYDNLNEDPNPSPSTRIAQVFSMDENDDQYEKVIIDKNKPNGGVISSGVVDDGEYDNDLIVTDHDPSLAEVNEKNVIMVVNRSATSSLSLSHHGGVKDEHIYMNVSTSKETPAIRESLGFDVADIVPPAIQREEIIYENGAGNVEEKFDSELVELNQQIKHLLAPSTNIPNQEHADDLAPSSSDSQAPSLSTNVSFRAPNSISNDDLNESSKNRDISDSIPKRKSTMGFDDLKRRRSIEQQQREESKSKIGIVPKTRQTISLANVETVPNSVSGPIQSISNPNPAKRNSNLKTTSNKSMSKSLQDNSKLVKQSSVEQPKLVVIETRSSSEQEEDKKSVSVKSKIQMMESIVQNRSATKTNERSSSTSSSTSSTSSSSSSSSSPPISPKSSHTMVVQPAVKSRQKPMAPLPPPVISTKPVKGHPDMSVSTEEEPTSSSLADDDLTAASLASLKEKRRTVKELMSKFEPK